MSDTADRRRADPVTRGPAIRPSRWSSIPTRGSATANSTPAPTQLGRRPSSRPVSARAPVSGWSCPTARDWVRIALAADRIGAVLVPLSTLLTGRELVAQLRAASVHAPDRGGGVSRAPVPGAGTAPTHGTSRRCARPGRPERAIRLPRAPGRQTIWSTRWRRPSRPATRWSSCSPRAAAVHPRASSTHTATPSARSRSGLAARCITADTRLYLPMPFFWVGGFGAGILSALLAGATLVTESMPDPRAPCDCWSASGSPCSVAGPIRPKPWRGMPTRPAPTCPRCGREVWRQCCRRAAGSAGCAREACSA